MPNEAKRSTAGTTKIVEPHSIGVIKILSHHRKSSTTTWERWEPSSFSAPNANPVAHGRPRVPRQTPAAAPEKDPGGAEAARLQDIDRQEGYRAGYDSGRAEGLLSGREAAATEGRALAAQLAGAIARFDQSIAEIELGVADQLLALSLGIARKLVHEAVILQPETVLATIREALAQLPVQHATIHLSGADAELVRSQAGDLLSRAGHRIQEDPQLGRGDVVVESGGTQLDARLATRWQRVVAALDQDMPWLTTIEPSQP